MRITNSIYRYPRVRKCSSQLEDCQNTANALDAITQYDQLLNVSYQTTNFTEKNSKTQNYKLTKIYILRKQGA